MDYEALYFGVTHKGHHLHRQVDHIQIEPSEIVGFPWSEYHIDTELLQSWGIADKPDGRVHWKRGEGQPLWFAFCWWDRSASQTTYANSGFYVRGFKEGEQTAAFRFACEKFPLILQRQKFRLTLQNLEATCIFPLGSS
jgi:glycerol kinase